MLLLDEDGFDKNSITISRKEIIADPLVTSTNTKRVIDSAKRFLWRPAADNWAAGQTYPVGTIRISATDGFRYQTTATTGNSAGTDANLNRGSDTGNTWKLIEGAYGSELTKADCDTLWPNGMYGPWAGTNFAIFPGDFAGVCAGETFYQVAIDPTFSGVTGALAADYNRQWRLPAATVGGDLLWGIKDTLATAGDFLLRPIEGAGTDNSHMKMTAVANGANWDLTLELKIDAKTMDWEAINIATGPWSAQSLTRVGAVEADYTLPDGTNFFAATVTFSSLRA